MFEQQPILVSRIINLKLPGPRHKGLTTMRTIFTCSLNCELRREHGTYGTNILYTPLDNIPLHSTPNMWCPWGCRGGQRPANGTFKGRNSSQSQGLHLRVTNTGCTRMCNGLRVKQSSIIWSISLKLRSVRAKSANPVPRRLQPRRVILGIACSGVNGCSSLHGFVQKATKPVWDKHVAFKIANCTKMFTNCS